jgi:ABC-type nitrate/sulfonate/bicarbonate transport system substrate-binding protein
MKLKYYLITISVLVLLTASTGHFYPAFSAAPEKVRLKLKWYHQFQFTGYYAAVKKGYYQDEGLDVELDEGSAAKSVIDTVVSGEAEFGVSDTEIAVEYFNGKPLVALAAVLV